MDGGHYFFAGVTNMWRLQYNLSSKLDKCTDYLLRSQLVIISKGENIMLAIAALSVCRSAQQKSDTMQAIRQCIQKHQGECLGGTKLKAVPTSALSSLL